MTLTRDPEKAKAWRQRSKGLTRGPGPKARKPMKRKNTKRSSAKHERNYGVGGRRGQAVRDMGCMIAGLCGHVCSWKKDACHSTARGMGGTKGGSGDLWDGCANAHAEAGELGTSQRAAFVEKYGKDPVERAAEIKARLDETLGEEPCWRCKEVGGHALTCSTVEARRSCLAWSDGDEM